MKAARNSRGMLNLGTTQELLNLLNNKDLSFGATFRASRGMGAGDINLAQLNAILSAEQQAALLNILALLTLMDEGSYTTKLMARIVHPNETATALMLINKKRKAKGATKNLSEDLKEYKDYLHDSIFGVPGDVENPLSIVELADLTQEILGKFFHPTVHPQTKEAIENVGCLIRKEPPKDTSAMGFVTGGIFKYYEARTAAKLEDELKRQEEEANKEYAEKNAKDERGEGGKYRRLEKRELDKCGPHATILSEILDAYKVLNEQSYEDWNTRLRELILAAHPDLLNKVNTAIQALLAPLKAYANDKQAAANAHGVSEPHKKQLLAEEQKYRDVIARAEAALANRYTAALAI